MPVVKSAYVILGAILAGLGAMAATALRGPGEPRRIPVRIEDDPRRR